MFDFSVFLSLELWFALIISFPMLEFFILSMLIQISVAVNMNLQFFLLISIAQGKRYQRLLFFVNFDFIKTTNKSNITKIANFLGLG